MEVDLSKVLEYSMDCLNNRAQLRSIMMDMYPDKIRDINIILAVYDSGIPKEIKNAGTVDMAMQYYLFVQRIEEQYGLQKKSAMEGINAWIEGFKKVGIVPPINAFQSESEHNFSHFSRKDGKSDEVPRLQKCPACGECLDNQYGFERNRGLWICQNCHKKLRKNGSGDYILDNYISLWHSFLFEFSKLGKYLLFFGIFALIVLGIIIVLFMPWYMWIVFIFLLVDSCVALKFGDAFYFNFWHGMTDSILAIDFGVLMEAINYSFFIFVEVSSVIFISITIAVFVINYLSSYLIARKSILK